MWFGVNLYQEKFPVGSEVVINDLVLLENFRASWKLHHPLEKEQIAFANQSTSVEAVDFIMGATFSTG